MGGLQNGLIQRSKNIVGDGFVELKSMDLNSEKYKSVISILDKNKVKYIPELELELLIQKDNYVAPVILHGVDYKYTQPPFLEEKVNTDIVIGSELAQKIKAFYGSRVKIISPSNTSILFQEIPNQVFGRVSDFYSSELPEIDSLHAWVKIEFLQNLIRRLQVNKLRIFDKDSVKIVENLYQTGKLKHGELYTWEFMNKALVWALGLETKVMLFLFIGMSFLIGICITSGFMIFYNKIKVDLSSYWILGLSRDEILKLIYRFSQSISVVFCLLGISLGITFLFLLDSNSLVLMPDYFVERNIPVRFDPFQIFIAFIVPYSVASILSHFTFLFFKKENHSFIQLIRKVS